MTTQPMVTVTRETLTDALALLIEAHDTHIFSPGDEHPDDCDYCASIADLKKVLRRGISVAQVSLHTNEQGEADTRLLSAAPTMLDELREQREAWGWFLDPAFDYSLDLKSKARINIRRIDVALAGIEGN